MSLAGLTIVRFDPSRLGLWTRPKALVGQVVPSSASEALVATDAEWVLDGTMFNLCDAPPGATEAQRYAASQCARPRFGLYDAARGIDIPSGAPAEGLTIGSYGDGSSFVVDGYTKPDGARVAVQLFPALVRGGNIVASGSVDTTAEWRAALASMNDGTLALAVAPASMLGFASALKAAGVRDAGYTDGGGSARLASASAVHGASENRRVAFWITVNSEGSLLPIAALGAAGAVGAGIFRWLTGRWPWE